jgi:predicted RNA-binding protein YlqC (UPF0109 family)
MSDTDRIEELVRYLVTSLVDAPDAVSINRVEQGPDVVLEITVDPDDVGKVVGKQGRIIKAIRTLARAASTTGSDDEPIVHVEVIG